MLIVRTHRQAAAAGIALIGASVLTLATAAPSLAENMKPAWLTVVKKTDYDGRTDDLVTGGLGITGMTSAAPAPGYADKLHPTAAGGFHPTNAGVKLPPLQ